MACGRFLHQDVFSRSDGSAHDVGLQVVRSGDYHRFDFGAFEESLPVGAEGAALVAGRELRGAREVGVDTVDELRAG
jgi:hypothetical protein